VVQIITSTFPFFFTGWSLVVIGSEISTNQHCLILALEDMNDTINIAESSAATPTYTLADVQKRNKAYGVWVITHDLG